MVHAVHVGGELSALRKGPITRQMLVEWCAAENDYYPLHYDERVAASMNLPGTPIQGTFRYALIGQMLSRWIAVFPNAALWRMSVSYVGLDLEGDTIIARGRVSDCRTREDGIVVDVEVWIENLRGEISSRGTATITMPSNGEPL